MEKTLKQLVKEQATEKDLEIAEKIAKTLEDMYGTTITIKIETNENN